MTSSSRDSYEVAIIGGGIAGNALATVLARAGKSVLVLERSKVYRDRVRGEGIQPWGVAEARRLGLHETLIGAGGIHPSRFVGYDETLEAAEAEATALALDKILPGVPGILGVGHPRACEALSTAAASAGALVVRGVEGADVEFDRAPAVRYSIDGTGHTARCRLVIGAEGRDSAVRRRAGIALHATRPRLMMAGMLVDELWGWPEHYVTIGTEGDLVFFIVPQGAGRVRLYLLWSYDQPRRFAGPSGAARIPRQLCVRLCPAERLHCAGETSGAVRELCDERHLDGFPDRQGTRVDRGRGRPQRSAHRPGPLGRTA